MSGIRQKMRRTRLTCMALMGVFVFAAGAMGQVEIEIGDAGLESALRVALGLPEGPITDVDLESLTELNAANFAVRDLFALQYCVNLTTLSLLNNAVSDLTPLSGLMQLAVLDLGKNAVTDIGPLATVTSMVNLSLWDNEVSDLAPLANMDALQNLFLMKNHVAEVYPLLGLGQLATLTLINNPLSADAVCTDIPALRAEGVTVLFFGTCPPLAPEDQQACLDACDGINSPDFDRDGLSDCEEGCLGTLTFWIDSDLDGVPDGYEVEYGLDPVTFDSFMDPDGDKVINFFEYLFRSDPNDPGSPEHPVFVAAGNGVDAPGRGGLFFPFATIGYALSQVEASQTERYAVWVFRGEYAEDVQLKQWVRVAGIGKNAVTVEGVIHCAPDAILQNVEVFQPAGASALAALAGANTKLDGVIFRGDETRAATGLLVTGAASEDALVTDCTFLSLLNGIDICGGIPAIRRSVFQDLAGSGIIIRAEAKSLASKGLGKEDDPSSGWNTFKSTVDGPAVVNQSGQSLSMENNDWDTDDPEQIEEEIDGDADFEPVLATGKGVLASSVFVSVTRTSTQDPVTDASVTLTPSAYQAVTENEKGVYAFPAVPEGNYTAKAVLPGGESGSASVRVQSGEIVAATIYIGAAENSGGCFGGGKSRSPLTSPGGAFVAALSLAVLLVMRGGFHRPR